VEAQKRKASVFACDAHSVFPSFPADTASPGTWSSYANTESFVKVWHEVFADDKFGEYDWTVKVDPDSVFFPDRLKKHLEDLRPPEGKPIYIKNTLTDFGFMGALEVISQVAAINLAENLRDCRTHIPDITAEDAFVKSCLDAVGAGSMIDEEILRAPNDLGDCGDWTRVVFHPHKAPHDWAACYDAATS